MCIAIYVPQGNIIPFEHLEEGARSNPDGCGMGWIEDGSLQIFTCMHFTDFVIEYNKVQERLDKPQMLIHFRITSKGATSLENCHPFWIDDTHILIHNGTFTSISKEALAGGRSDTAVFAEDILSQLPLNWEYNQSILFLLEDFVGYSKVIILDEAGNVTFLNENGGFWVEGIWYSNKTYVKYLPAVRTAYKSNYSDNYKESEWGTFKKHNEEWCDVCCLPYKYDELIWVDKECICSKCFRDNKHLPKVVEQEDKFFLEVGAGVILQNAKEDRIFELTDCVEIETCEGCSEEMFSSDLYAVWVDSKDAELQGHKIVCEGCFKLLYISDDVDAVEIIH